VNEKTKQYKFTTLNALAKEAAEKIVFSSDEPDDADWGVFFPDQKKWKFGPSEQRQKKSFTE